MRKVVAIAKLIGRCLRYCFRFVSIYNSHQRLGWRPKLVRVRKKNGVVDPQIYHVESFDRYKGDYSLWPWPTPRTSYRAYAKTIPGIRVPVDCCVQADWREAVIW